ncbi:hypothetical protein DMA11_14060 [Marinilabiliaceae bacterium JC017]|nr:hypothetical protein DMA11_14060 [Marinilabiliaceae bacterium JC017]
MRKEYRLRIYETASGGAMVFVLMEAEDGQMLNFIIDTGAPITLIDQKHFHEKRTPTSSVQRMKWGNASIDYVNEEIRMRFQSGFLIKMKVAISDLQTINSSISWLGFEPVDGLLGADFLLRYKAVLDFFSEKMVLTI